MKNKMKDSLKLAVLCLMAGITFAACSDWTEVEGVNVEQQSPADKYPELYAQYLQKLRNYKQAEHKVVYAWFDNSQKAPFSRGQHITAVPDSVDVIALMFPDKLADFELKEMESVRSEKGTKVVYTISYEAIKRAYDELVKAETAKDAAYVAPNFEAYLKEATVNALKLQSTYNYDGIIVGYKGKSMLHMTAAEKEQYTKEQTVFMNEISAWYTANKNKMIAFEGYPQYVVNREILKSCRNIILNTADLTTSSMLTVEALQAIVPDVPTEQFVVTARTTSLDSTNKKTGYYDGSLRAITEAAYWVTNNEVSFTKAGLGIYNVQNDYYNPNNVYQYVRQAINIMNPAPKN